MESLNSNSQEIDLHQLQQMQDNEKERCMGEFERAFVALFDQDVQTFTCLMLLNMDQLEKQLDKEEFQETGSMGALRYFLAYTRTEVRQFRDTLIQHMESVKKSVDERAQHKQRYDSWMNDRQMQSKEGKVHSSKVLDDSLVVTECSGIKSDKQDTSNKSGNDTHAEDVDIKPMNDKEPMAEVQLTVQHNVLANEQQHFVQSEPIYDTHLLEKVDRNTTPDLTNMCHGGGEID
ncbi:hypothetical protein Tco_1080562 [Tanacetum coccineum]|uniref:Uncharacterized protein n=1 Tax=Tanacetum coccineum TaxID=301880 RepID=A0ABQ5HX02_9ASTR